MIKLFDKYVFYKKGLSITYSAIILDQKSKNLLLNNFIYNDNRFINWKIICDHMTICLGELPEHLKRYWLDEEVTLTATEIGISDKSVAVKISGFFNVGKVEFEDDIKIPHITLAINPFDAKPVDSNSITNWTPIKHIKLRGVVTEVIR
jgi:hypothetical protein